MNKKRNNKIFFLFLALFFLFGIYYSTLASDEKLSVNGNDLQIKISQIKKSEGLNAFDNEFKMDIPEKFASGDTIINILKIGENIPATGTLKRISDIYQYDFKQAKINNSAGFITLKVKYSQSSNNFRRLYYYDKNLSKWKPFVSTDNYKKMTIEAKTNMPFARVAVFEDENVPVVGYATWYSHKGGLFAASPDFAKGSRLRVFNLENGKFVDVDVNDFGPDRGVHPDRVLDLDKPAFAKLSSVKGGKIKVFIQPIHIVNVVSEASTKSNVAAKIVGNCSLIMNEKTGSILLEKNADKVLPLASLTKLIAATVFINTNPNLDRIVTYKKQDEEYNYKYVENKWESARLKVMDGETMKLRDWLYAALVGSANNSVEGLVRASGYSRDAFIKKMNETVKKWGAENTYFIEPTGLSPQNVSSCRDYAIITREVFKNQTIAKVSATVEYDFDTINTKNHHHLKNTNSILQNKNYTVTGSKTGYLYEAGHCLMTRFKASNEQTLIAVEFGTDSKYSMYKKMYELIDYGIKKTK